MGIDIASCSQIASGQCSNAVGQGRAGNSSIAHGSSLAVSQGRASDDAACHGSSLAVSHCSAGNGAAGSDIHRISEAAFRQCSNAVGHCAAGDGAGGCKVFDVSHVAICIYFYATDLTGSGGHLASGIYRESSVRTFDAAVGIESGLGIGIIISAGINTIFIHQGTIGAYLDAILAEGNLIGCALVYD